MDAQPAISAADHTRQFTLRADALDLESTLDGGQAFRWWRVASESISSSAVPTPAQPVAYDGVIGSTAVRISELATDPSTTSASISVEVRSPGDLSHDFQRTVADYLGIHSDMAPLQAEFADDPCIGPAISGFPGLRLLRQDPWECLISFICSSTSNIPRIKLNVGAVAREIGTRVGPADTDFAFPAPAAVAGAGEQFLRDLGLGFRAKFVIPAAEAVAGDDLDLLALREAPYEDARAALVSLHGVGEKIADCVLAFSLDKPEAFPVDSKAAEFARSRFGNFGAVAQQYMFHRERLAQRAKWGGAHVANALPEDRA